MAKKDKQIDAAIKLYLEQYLNKTRVDRIILAGMEGSCSCCSHGN